MPFKVFTILAKGNLCDFLFAFLDKIRLKGSILQTNTKNLLQQKLIPSTSNKPNLRRRGNENGRVASPGSLRTAIKTWDSYLCPVVQN